MTDFYKTLEIDKNASNDEIKKAYKKLALKWHPDKNPDNEEEANAKFQAITEAYSVLSDPKKRQMYDLSESNNFNGFSGFNGSDGFDSFNEFKGFNEFNEFSQFDTKNNQNNSFYKAFYTTSPNMNSRKIFDDFFAGSNPFGNQNFTTKTTRKSRFDPFIDKSTNQSANQSANQHTNQPELNIHVQKVPFTLEELYTGCNKKIKINNTTLDINAMPGWKDGEGVTYSGIIPDSKLKIAVQELPHNIFRREESDLHMTLKITLNEALHGFTKEIKKLDNTAICLSLEKIKSSDYVHKLESQGMPIRKDKKQIGYGNLYIHFIVTF